MGLLLAHYLLKQGNYHVSLYERRPDPRLTELPERRTFPISLELKALTPIDAIPGLIRALGKQGTWCTGTIMYRKGRAPEEVRRQTPALLISRNQLTQVLLEKLLTHYSEDVLKLQFDCTCIEVNPVNQSIVFQTATRHQFTTHYDHLVAADGVHSKVRQCLVQGDYLNAQQTMVPDAYRTLSMPRKGSELSTELAADRVHVWQLFSHGMQLVMASRRSDDRLYGSVMFDPNNHPWDSLTTDKAVLSFFQEYAPTIGHRMSLADAGYVQQQPNYPVFTVKCDRLHVGQHILLIGDAAHAISPTTGQGCLAALQDAQIFAQVLEQCRGQWEQALPLFTAQRLPDVRALTDLPNNSLAWKQRVTIQRQALIKLLLQTQS